MLRVTMTVHYLRPVRVSITSSCYKLFLSTGNRGQRNGYLGKQEQRFIPL